MRLTKFLVPGVFHNSHSKRVIDQVKREFIIPQFQRTRFYKAWQKKYLRDKRTDYERFKCAHVRKLRCEAIERTLKMLTKKVAEDKPDAKQAKTGETQKAKSTPKPKTRLSAKAKDKLAKH